jgi:tetraacyldisaccharide 4'-kinase
MADRIPASRCARPIVAKSSRNVRIRRFIGYAQFLPKIKNRYIRAMRLLRKLTFPFAVLYGWITGLRNYFYDKGWLSSASFDVPVIAVGNLSVGGTGKSPMIEYLIRLLSADYKVATLSRGYRRKSKAFVLADADAKVEELGDEPFQFHRKFPGIRVAVDAERRHGIQQLMQIEKPDVILLDDAFQHRKVQAGFYILLTAYGDLFSDDFMLPAGNLREPRRGKRRADVVVVTKCPDQLSAAEMSAIERKLNVDSPVFFSKIAYAGDVVAANETLPLETVSAVPKLLVAGIAKPQPFFDLLKTAGDDTLAFPDHHEFTSADVQAILTKAKHRKIITTEKDYVRLRHKLAGAPLFYLPIETVFQTGSGIFDQIILDYVGKRTKIR